MNARYAIYLPEDTEKWFDATFSSESRAHWYAEMNKLEPHEYDVRNTFSNPTEEKDAA